MRFIDHTIIHVNAGNGGHGCIAFLREKFRPKGGPSGGDGGHGGHIIINSNNQLSTLQDLSLNRRYKAGNGGHGKGKNCHGRNGKDQIIRVPVGTVVRNLNTKQVLFDFNKEDEKFIIAKGGNGGFGNARFKSKNNPTPKNANDGQKGEEISLELELKIIADVGLVGFPNAGKSTYISKISNSKPKIADYPFTTLIPNLGIVKYGEYNSFVMADIPGLIEGAAKGKGLGSQFLKHIERTKILVFLIDSSSKNILKDYRILRKELERHNKRLNDLPSILLLSKSDIEMNKEHIAQPLPEEIDIIRISSLNRKNLEKSIKKIAYLIAD